MTNTLTKKTILLICMVFCGIVLWAQDTVRYPYYRYMELAQYDTNEIHYSSIYGQPVQQGIRCYVGPVYWTNLPQTIYGIAVAAPYITFTNDPKAVRIAQKIEGEGWMFIDSTIWLERQFDRYMEFANMSDCRNTSITNRVFPVYEVYFNHPISVDDSFSVGCGYYYSDMNISPAVGGAPKIFSIGLCDNTSGQWHQTIGSSDGNTVVYETFHTDVEYLCIFPILVPPDTDSYVCAEVDSVRVQGSGTGWVNVAWTPGSEDQDLFQIAYGVRGEDPAQYASVINQESPRVIFDDAIDTGVYYSVRVRGRCHHRCAVHDTLMWGPWSEPVHFYVGNHEPGTGIAAPEETPAFSLNPNPTKGEVNIEVKGERWKVRGREMTVTVCDASGREVRRQTLLPTTEDTRLHLDLKGLPAGAYFVTLVTPQGSHTEKLVVE